MLTLCCSSPGNPPAEQSVKAGPLSLSDLAGCYELETLRWRKEPHGVEAPLFTPPRFFELTLQPLETTQEYYVVKNRVPGSKHRFSTWRLENDRQVFINWGTGFVGVSVLAERGQGDRSFRGLAETYTDIHGGEGFQAEITFSPVPCSRAN